MHFAPEICCKNEVNRAGWRTVTMWVVLIETLMGTYLYALIFNFLKRLD